MRVQEQRQLSPVSDEVLALTAIVRPILRGVLYSLKKEIVDQVGGYENVNLMMLPRLRREGDGDCGICFEYCVHEAMMRGDPRVLERIQDATRLCNFDGQVPKSILFGVEKSGGQQLIGTAMEVLTNDSRVLSGVPGQPAKLRRYLNTLAAAFRRPSSRLALPYSINGLWKADLFVGYSDTDRWVGTSVKINPAHLEEAAGLRIGIIPVRQGATDRVRRHETKNLVICPLHHDADFMQAFYEGWRIVQAFLNADAQVPREVALPRPVDREVARILAERRGFPTLDVIEAIKAFGQPDLLHTDDTQADLYPLSGDAQTDMIVAPAPQNVD
ncbi:MAG: hypothetical protein H6884_09730 [Rhodobiaceae bacterium]|nr:hypothetical protein [Rhodobiaceae bacterium]